MNSISDGQTQIEHLIREELRDNRAHAIQLHGQLTEHVISDGEATRDVLSHKMDQLKVDDGHRAQYEKLLKSLKYETMNERRNQISDAHDSTFQWIFGAEVPAVSTSVELW